MRVGLWASVTESGVCGGPAIASARWLTYVAGRAFAVTLISGCGLALAARVLLMPFLSDAFEKRVGVSIWVLALGLAMAEAYRLTRRRPVVEGPVCQKCGYCLRGLRDPRCPECGTAFGLGDNNSG